MRRLALALIVLAFPVGFAVAGCGGEEEAAPAPDTVVGTLPTGPTTTEPTDTDTTETTDTDTTETTDTETETETDGGTVDGDPVAGKQVFLGPGGCGACHTLSDAGTNGSIGPNLDDSKPDLELTIDRVTNGRGAMPAFDSSLSEQQIADVSAYVVQASGG